MSLRLSCGNICDICSTCAGVNRRPLRRDVDSLVVNLEDIKYRMMKKDRTATKASEGIESVASSSRNAIVVGIEDVRLGGLLEELAEQKRKRSRFESKGVMHKRDVNMAKRSEGGSYGEIIHIRYMS